MSKHEMDSAREKTLTQERFLAWLRGTSEVVYLMNPDWSEMRQLHGNGFLADTESADNRWSDKYLHPDDLPRIRGAIQNAVRTKGLFSLEHRVRRADGTWGWAFSRAAPILDQDGQILEWFGIATDVTSREERLAKSELRAREEAERRAADWEAVFDAASEGFRVFDETGRTVAMNAVALKVAGADSPDDPSAMYVNHPSLAFYGWDGQPLQPDELPSAMAFRGCYVHDFPVRLVNAKGEVYYLLSSTTPLKTPEGQPKRFLLSTRDETTLQKVKDRQAFLLELSDALRPLSDARKIQDTAASLLADHLSASQASYSEHDQLNDAKSVVAGTHKRSDFSASVAILRTGRYLVVRDVLSFPEYSKEESAHMLALNTRASISVPLVKEGRLVAALTVRQSAPREWTAEEVELVRETAERTWAAVERAKAEGALRESEKLAVSRAYELEEANRQKADVLESISDCFYALDKDLCFTYVNKAAEEIWGMSRAELLGRRIEDVFPGLIDISMSKFQQALAEQTPQHYEVFSKVAHKWGDMSVCPTPDGISVYFRDKTERKRAEEAVATERQWLQALLDSMTDEVWFTDADGSVRAANARAMAGLGFSDTSETDKKIVDLSAEVNVLKADGTPKPPEEMPPLRVLRGEPLVSDIEVVRHKKTGELRYRDIICSPVRDSTGKTVGAVSVIRDTTESRRRQRELDEVRQEAEQRAAEWNALIHGSPDAIYLTDESGTVLEANSAWYRASGFEQGEPVPGALELPQLIMTMPDGSPMAMDDRPTARALRGDRVANLQYRMVDVKGQEHDFLQNTTAIDTPNGKRTLSIVTDITEFKRLERLKDEFMLVVGHELRNPLQVILGRLQLVEMKFDQGSRKAYGGDLESLKTQANLLRSIVEDLLNAYRVGSGRLSVDMARTDLKGVVVSALEPFLTEPYHRWSFSLPRTRVEVMADPLRLRQAVTNLLTNAQKYTPTGKAIRVSLKSRKGSMLLIVEDEGVGIPPEDLEKIFDGFYRTPDVTKWQPGSVGLGLYISRGLVRRMGGNLWAENRPGGGTMMCLKMPLIK